MNKNNLEWIMSIVEAIEISDDGLILVNGAPTPIYHKKAYTSWEAKPSQFGSNNISSHNPDLNDQLMYTIYEYFYNLGDMADGTKPKDPRLNPGYADRQKEFMNSLLPYIHTTRMGNSFWKVTQFQNGQVHAYKNEDSIYINEGHFQPHDINQPVRIGSYIQVKKTISDRTIQSDFFYIFGNEMVMDELDLFRVYFNMKFEHVHHIVEILTIALNRYDIPFCFKCLNEAANYYRADNGVLYIDTRYWQLFSLLMPQLIEEIKDFVNSSTPLFTKTIIPGIAVAEDPGSDQSFGQTRCSMLAIIILQARKESKLITKNYIKAAYKALGFDIEKLHLNPYSFRQFNY